MKLVEAAGLVETLSKKQYTVFAPTDDAFAKVDAATLEGLLADTEQLKKVLLHHVVVKANNSKKVTGAEKVGLTTLAETSLAVKVARDNSVTIGSAKLVKPDIKCRNGFIHVIDSVLMP